MSSSTEQELGKSPKTVLSESGCSYMTPKNHPGPHTSREPVATFLDTCEAEAATLGQAAVAGYRSMKAAVADSGTELSACHSRLDPLHNTIQMSRYGEGPFTLLLW